MCRDIVSGTLFPDVGYKSTAGEFTTVRKDGIRNKVTVKNVARSIRCFRIWLHEKAITCL